MFLKDILRNIFEEITQFAKIKYTVFIWEKDCVASSLSNVNEITTPLSVPAINDTLSKFKELIKKQFDNCDTACYSYVTPTNPIVSKFDILFGIKPTNSVYAKSITFRNQKEGFLIFVDPEVTEDGFDKDCDEFLNLVAERIKSQIDIYVTDEAKSEFIAEMSHRLKSPMQNIMDQSGYLEEYLKKEHPDDSKGESIVLEIIDGVAHLDHQIKNYSYITTIDKEGGWSYDFQFHPIVTLVIKCVRRFRPSARIRGIKIIIHLPEEDKGKRIEFDWDTIDIVVNNLLDNAVKYSHFKRDIFIELSFNDDKRACSISISNRGLGIAHDEYEKIFEKYYRARSIKDPIRWIPGTGIGLSVVNKIVDAHQGRIMVTSELLKEKEKGDVYLTTFKIFLPYKREGDN